MRMKITVECHDEPAQRAQKRRLAAEIARQAETIANQCETRIENIDGQDYIVTEIETVSLTPRSA